METKLKNLLSYNVLLKKRRGKVRSFGKMWWQCFEMLSAIRLLMIFVLKMIWYCDINIHSDAMLLWCSTIHDRLSNLKGGSFNCGQQLIFLFTLETCESVTFWKYTLCENVNPVKMWSYEPVENVNLCENVKLWTCEKCKPLWKCEVVKLWKM